jgi:AraC-like DNA-binding protein
MTAQLPETDASGRTDFTTTDAGTAVDYYQSVYRTKMTFEGVKDGLKYGHRRLDAGEFAIDEVRIPIQIGVAQDPFNALLVINVQAGRFERDCAGISERFVAGDAFVHADPVLPVSARMLDVHLQTVLIDLSLLAQVATTRAPGPICFTAFQPVSDTAATHWKNTANYLAVLLGDPVTVAQPLIRGSAARLLAAAALTTFPNTAATEPTAQDRRDATSATARRAIAYMEQNLDADISVADIATAANVSIRAVQLAFRRHFDATPMQYLRKVRLHQVHRELLATDPASGATVTDIATRWGFYSLSRFATHYRRAFGEAPRETLRGASQQRWGRDGRPAPVGGHPGRSE